MRLEQASLRLHVPSQEDIASCAAVESEISCNERERNLCKLGGGEVSICAVAIERFQLHARALAAVTIVRDAHAGSSVKIDQNAIGKIGQKSPCHVASFMRVNAFT